MMLLATRDALPTQVPANIRATAPIADALSLTVPDLPWTADRWPLADQVSALQSLCGVLQPADRLEQHEACECGHRPVQCPLGCGDPGGRVSWFLILILVDFSLTM